MQRPTLHPYVQLLRTENKLPNVFKINEHSCLILTNARNPSSNIWIRICNSFKIMRDTRVRSWELVGYFVGTLFHNHMGVVVSTIILLQSIVLFSIEDMIVHDLFLGT